MNSTVSLVLKLVLTAVIAYLAYVLYAIIQEPIQFEKLKKDRYTKVQTRLEQIRDVQKVYKTEYGQFAEDMNALIAFVDTGRKSIVQQKDSSYSYYNKTFQKEMMKDTVLITILGYQPVKEHLFDADFDPSVLAKVPETDNEEFIMSATRIQVNDVIMPVFEAKATNKQIFKDVLKKYDQYIDEEAVLSVGSLTEPTLSGNWR